MSDLYDEPVGQTDELSADTIMIGTMLDGHDNFIKWSKDQLMQQRWYPQEGSEQGYYREGFNACLRLLLDNYEMYKRGE